MEPSRSPSSRPSTPRPEEYDVNAAFGTLTIDGREAQVRTAEVPLVNVYEWIQDERISPPTQRRVVTSVNNNNNVINSNNNNETVNNNNVNNNSIEVVDPDTQVFNYHIWRALGISYETTQSMLGHMPQIHEVTFSTPLHIALKYLKKEPKLTDRLLVLITCLLEAGLDKEFINSEQITPFMLALDLENELLFRLFTHEKPCKATLFELAKEYNLDSLIDFLEYPTFWVDFYKACPRFLDQIEENHSDIYNKVFAFYTTHEKVVTYVMPTTGRTVLHDAVVEFTKENLIAIFECFVFLQKGADKFAKNSKGETPFSLAQASKNSSLIALFELEKPTLADFNKIIGDHPVIPAWLNN